jgi:hypothetical protein
MVVLCGALSASASESSDRSLAVHILGLYDSPVKPTQQALHFSDGFGFQFLPELQLNSFLGFGLGLTTEYLYGSGGSAMRVGTFDFSASARMPSKGEGPQPYAQVQYGLNALPRSGNHWKGSRRVAFVLGTRLPMGFGMGLDLGLREELFLPKPNDLQCVSVHLGLVSEFDLKHHENKSTPTPKAKVTFAPSSTATLTASPSPTVTSTSVVSVATPRIIPTKTTEIVWTVTATPTLLLRQKTLPPTPSRTPSVASSPTTTPEATKRMVEASERMLDLYEKGIEEYKTKGFEPAIVHLKGALDIKDAKVEYWYYAEANAMLGAIYHYHKTVPGHLETARKFYQAALKIDPATTTAKRGLKALSAKPTSGKLKNEGR